MWERLEEVLKAFEEEEGCPYYRQGSLLETEELPPSFVCFWNTSSPEGQFYDNKPHEAVWTWVLYVYTNKATELYSLADKLGAMCRDKGFILQGRATDLASGIDGFFGRFFTIKILENYSEEENKNG